MLQIFGILVMHPVSHSETCIYHFPNQKENDVSFVPKQPEKLRKPSKSALVRELRYEKLTLGNSEAIRNNSRM